jgi:sugar/nucleoside kinase (ribokinase family)
MQKIYDILVAGEINPDLILSGNVEPAFGQVEKLVDSAVLAIGSSSAIFACGAAQLGLKVAFIGVCGDDTFGRFMLDEMKLHGVDTSNVLVDSREQTGLSVILNRGSDRAILTHPGLIGALTSADVTDRLLREAQHLHVASYFLQTALQPGLSELFTRAHALGLSTSLDTNWDPSGNWSAITELLRGVDVFLPNRTEALVLAGANEVGSAIQRLSDTCKMVAIKMGEEGAIACSGGNIVRVAALKVAVVDTVGAGDSFDAGFVYGFIKGWELKKALYLAIACGSLSTRQLGGTAAQPTLEEAMKYVASAG